MANIDSVERIRNRLETVKSCPGPEGCASCDCYQLLLFYLMEELSHVEGSEAKALLQEISQEFNGRRKLKLHGCRGCAPCLSAEWAAEFAKKEGAR